MSTLFLVATPIGNLEDISTRAVRILREASLIAAEDTRHTGRLLAHFGIETRLTSYFEHNTLNKLDAILSALDQGDVALVSDAGTPALNDPGYELVRAALQAGHQVSPIPGPSAPLAALVASGLPTDRFLYLGYLPRKAGERRQAVQDVLQLPYTLVCLETPHRLLAALADLYSILGDRQVAVARELTKLYEEIYRGSLTQAQAYYQEHPPKGEITLVIAGANEQDTQWDSEQVHSTIEQLLASGKAASDIARQVAQESGWSRRSLYQLVLDIQNN